MSVLRVLVPRAFAGCASLESVAPPVTPAMRGAPASTLEEGRGIFTRTCTACHAADAVSEHSVGEWREIVARMSHRAKLDAARESALLAYLTAAHSTPPAR